MLCIHAAVAPPFALVRDERGQLLLESGEQRGKLAAYKREGEEVDDEGVDTRPCI